jgi:hypothetical protein
MPITAGQIELLKQTGFTQEQIDALDPRLANVWTGITSAAEQKEKEAVAAAARAEADRKAAEESAKQAEAAREAAKAAQDATELEKRSNVEFYETKVMPGLLGFEEEKKNLETARINAESRATFYETQVKGLKDAGFLPADAPAFVVPNSLPANNAGSRDGQGRFVAGTNGSPVFDPNTVVSKVGDAYNTINDIMYEHQILFGKPLPIAPSQLIAQADALKLSPAAYAERTFNFTAKKHEMAETAKREHDEQIRAAERTEQEAKWKAELDKVRSEAEASRKKLAEGMTGNNPEVRVAVSSKMPEIARAVKAGERPDPLKMTDSARRQATRTAVHNNLSEREQAVA